MATPAVLRSRDCLRRNPQFNHTPKPLNRSRFNPEFNSRRNENKNRIPVAITGPKFPNFGEVKILKRGDPLPVEKKIESNPPPVEKKIESNPPPVEKKIEFNPPVKKKTTAFAVEKPLESGKPGKSNDSDLMLGSGTRFGPEPEMVQKQVADFNLAPPKPSSHFYAGSAPSMASPHPSSLPLPVALIEKSIAFFP